jgi:hypothetical protein
MKKIAFAALTVFLLTTFVGEASAQRRAAAQTSWEGIVLEEGLVAEVKRADADFARVLDLLRQHTEVLAAGSAKVYLLPEAQGKPDGPAASLEDELYSMVNRFDEKERKGPPLKPTEYEVTLDRANNSALATLKIRLLGRNPNAGSRGIIINLTKTEKGGWQVSGWEARPAN